MVAPQTSNPCENTPKEPLYFSGQITQADLESSVPFSSNTVKVQSISCIYSEALEGNLSVQVFGSDCFRDQLQFGQGLLRGTLRPCIPCCGKE